MRSLAAFADLARSVGACNPCNPRGYTSGLQENTSDISAVTAVTLVTRENDVAAHGSAPRFEDEDRQAAFDERAAILEYDAGMSRADAEQMARDEMGGWRE